MTAVLFDLDDTLYERLVPFRNAYEEKFGKKYTLSVEELFRANSRHSDEVFELSSAGAISMREMYIYRIQKAFQDLGISVGEEECLRFQEAYARQQKHLMLTEGIEELLCLCRDRGIPLGLITNGPASHQWEKVRNLKINDWIPQEHIFISGELGVTKPDVSIFRHAGNVMGISGQDIYYVGDSFRNDVMGASNAGWTPVWLNKKRETPEQKVSPMHVVTCVQELRTLFSEILI
jgi:putative hydrolase of the HAD superfamily